MSNVTISDIDDFIKDKVDSFFEIKKLESKTAKWTDWHDLIKNPKDLPEVYHLDWVLVIIKEKDTRLTLVPKVAEHRKDGHWYQNDFSNSRLDIGAFEVIKWTRLPVI